jgi:hypothetical protein
MDLRDYSHCHKGMVDCARPEVRMAGGMQQKRVRSIAQNKSRTTPVCVRTEHEHQRAIDNTDVRTPLFRISERRKTLRANRYFPLDDFSHYGGKPRVIALCKKTEQTKEFSKWNTEFSKVTIP